MAEKEIEYLIPWAEIDSHERRLPHWQQGRVAILVTWRLADSLPQARFATWYREREAWLAHHPMPWDEVTRRIYAEEFGQTIDRWLDAGFGTCVLRDTAAREELLRVLQTFDGVRYRLHAWVVMPNHVHGLFSPAGPQPADQIVGAWKGVSARRIHECLDRKGSLPLPPPRLPGGVGEGARALLPAGLPGEVCAGARALLPAQPNRGRLWQPESWDTLIRSPAHFEACRRYIANNPTWARLAPADFALWLEESAH